MILHGFIMSADLAEEPPGSGRIELTLRVQGVGPGQPRRLVVPHEVLLADPSIDPDDVVGRGFEAEVELIGRAVPMGGVSTRPRRQGAPGQGVLIGRSGNLSQDSPAGDEQGADGLSYPNPECRSRPCATSS